jgi:hypothetical protein
MTIQPYDKKNLLLRCESFGKWFTILKALPGNFKWKERDLLFAPVGANIAYLMEQCPDAEWKDGAERIRDEYILLKQQEDNTRAEKKDQLIDESGYEYKTAPFAHQRQAFLLSRERKVFALFHEQGCGKTKVIIDTAAYLFERGLIDRLVIVAKNGVHHNWIINEIPAHLPDRIGRTLAFYTAGKKKNIDPKTRPGKLHCMAFAVEGFSSERAREILEAWIRSGKALLVVDESSTIKNPSAQRTKFLIKIGELAKYRRIMTGTPITRGQENLFSQFKFLDEDILGHRNFTTFRADYCIMGGFEGRAIVGYKKTEELTKIVDGHSHRVLKVDCLDLPPKIYKRQPFELHEGQRSLYDAYRKSAIEELQRMLEGHRDETWVLEKAKELAITKALRRQQIGSGLMPDASGQRLPGEKMNARMDALWTAIEEMGDGKLIIWVRFKQDLIDIHKALEKDAVGYYGGIKEQQRIDAVQKFVHNPKIKFFVASSAAAYGHSLPAIGAIYHSQSSSLDIRLQSEDRCHGINRTIGPTATYVDLEAIRTVDQKIIKALRSNKAIADIVLQDPVRLFMEEEEDGREQIQ